MVQELRLGGRRLDVGVLRGCSPSCPVEVPSVPGTLPSPELTKTGRGKEEKPRPAEEVGVGRDLHSAPLSPLPGALGAAPDWGGRGLVSPGLKVAWHCSRLPLPTSQRFPAEQRHVDLFYFLVSLVSSFE